MRFFKYSALTLCGGALGYGVGRLAWDLLRFDCATGNALWRSGGGLPGAVAGALLFLVCFRRQADTAWRCWLPVLPGAVPMMLFPREAAAWCGFVLCAGCGVLRCGGAGIFESRRFVRIRRSAAELLSCRSAAVIFFIAAFAAGFLMQFKAFHSYYLDYLDWGEYAELYLRGKWGVTGAGHCNILPDLLLFPLMRALPSPGTLFAVNAALIASAVPLTRQLAVNLRASKTLTALAMLCGVFMPGLTGQYLCLFYGYHPVVFLVPILLAFFCCRAVGNRVGMALFFTLSLAVQETVALFWCGWALQLLARRDWKRGCALFVAMAGLFWLMASCISGGAYVQAGRYAALGGSPAAVALSPFRDLPLFCRTLFSMSNLRFVLYLMIPAGFAAAAFPRVLIAGAPILAGVLLQSYDSGKNLASQYALELSVLILAAAVEHLARLGRGAPSPVLRGVMAGIPGADRAGCQYRGSMWALPVLLVASHLLLGQSLFLGARAFWGPERGGLRSVGNLPDGAPVTQFLERFVPPSARLLASGRVRSRMLFRNVTAPPDSPPRPGDVIVVDLDDIFPNDRLRTRLFADPQVHPCTTVNWRGMRLALYRVSPPGVPKTMPPFLRKCPPLDPASAGTPFGTGDECISLQVLPGNRIGATIVKTPPGDVDLLLYFSDGRRLQVPFAHGFLPANAAPPGTMFLFPAEPGLLSVRIRRR